jgi:tetratricopeptide (TPR) repeat protein
MKTSIPLSALLIATVVCVSGCVHSYDPSKSGTPKLSKARARAQLRQSAAAGQFWTLDFFNEHEIKVQQINFQRSAIEVIGQSDNGQPFQEQYPLDKVQPYGMHSAQGASAIFYPFRTLNFGSPDPMRLFVDALYALKHATNRFELDLDEYRKSANSWREAHQGAVLSEEAERHRVLAEHSVKEQRFDEALDHYETALALQPYWPEGRYNAAIISAELHDYTEAADHMRCYLVLVPEVGEAEALREKVIIWEEKAKSR